MARQHIYTVLSSSEPNYSVVKMERDFEPVETYTVTRILGTTYRLECTCFASNKETCRHRQIVELFCTHNLVNSRKAYDFDKKLWIEPPKQEA